MERLTSKTMGARARGRPEDFDPMMLHGAFEKMISDLQEKNAKVQKDIDSWEAAAREEEKRHWGRVGELQKTNQVGNYYQGSQHGRKKYGSFDPLKQILPGHNDNRRYERPGMLTCSRGQMHPPPSGICLVFVQKSNGKIWY